MAQDSCDLGLPRPYLRRVNYHSLFAWSCLFNLTQWRKAWHWPESAALMCFMFCIHHCHWAGEDSASVTGEQEKRGGVCVSVVCRETAGGKHIQIYVCGGEVREHGSFLTFKNSNNVTDFLLFLPLRMHLFLIRALFSSIWSHNCKYTSMVPQLHSYVSLKFVDSAKLHFVT